MQKSPYLQLFVNWFHVEWETMPLPWKWLSYLFHKEARLQKHLLKTVPVSLGRGMGFSEGHMPNKLAALALARFLAVRKFCLVHTLLFYKEARVWKYLAKSVPVSLGGMGFSEGHHAKQSGRSSFCPLAGSKKVLSGLRVTLSCFLKKLGYENIWQRVYLCH